MDSVDKHMLSWVMEPSPGKGSPHSLPKYFQHMRSHRRLSKAMSVCTPHQRGSKFVVLISHIILLYLHHFNCNNTNNCAPSAPKAFLFLFTSTHSQSLLKLTVQAIELSFHVGFYNGDGWTKYYSCHLQYCVLWVSLGDQSSEVLSKNGMPTNIFDAIFRLAVADLCKDETRISNSIKITNSFFYQVLLLTS
jgi:hypothetical protein